MNTAMKVVVFLFLWCFLCLVIISPPRVVASATITISNPSVTDDTVTFTVNILGITASGLTDGKGYLQAMFVGSDSKSFGYTKNNSGDWYEYIGEPTADYIKSKFYYFTPVDGSWSDTMTAKNNYDDSSYKGPGNYILRVKRYTGGSTSSAGDPSNDLTVNLSHALPTLTPSPTSSSLTQKSTYKINNAKDENGNILNQVKIYVDSQYTGNYTDETYTFCDSCKCGSNNIPCGYGSHTFKTEKDGYLDWSETKNIIAGETYEVSPVMNKESSSTVTPTSTPTKTPTPSPTKTPTPKPTATSTPTPSSSPETSPPEVRVLGAEIVLSPTPRVGASDSKKIPAFAYVFIVVGVLVLGVGGYLLFVSSKKEYNGKTDEGQIES